MIERIRKRPADFLVTSALLALGIYGLVTALGFSSRASTWPIAIMSLLILGALTCLATFLFGPRDALSQETMAAVEAYLEETQDTPAAERAAEPAGTAPLWVRTVSSTALIAVFILVAPMLGLFVTAGLYLFAHMLFLGIRPVWLSAVSAAGAALVLWFFFGNILGVYIPGTWLI